MAFVADQKVMHIVCMFLLLSEILSEQVADRWVLISEVANHGAGQRH